MARLLDGRLTVRPERSERPEEFVAVATLQNVGDETVILDLGPLISRSLALEVVHDDGSPAPLPPPPVPGAPTEKARLAPGNEHRVEFRGFVPQWFTPGTYRARLRYFYQPDEPAALEWTGRLESDWAQFTLG